MEDFRETIVSLRGDNEDAYSTECFSLSKTYDMVCI